MPRIRVANLTPFPFSGWCRATVDDHRLPSKAGMFDESTMFVAGELAGNVRTVDVRCKLEPGAARMLMLDGSDVRKIPVPLQSIALPTRNPICIGNHAMTMIEAARDGAALTCHLRDRVGDFVVNVWLLWYPGEPTVQGKAIVVHSNPNSPNLSATAQNDAFQLSWQGAIATRPDAGGPQIGPLLLVANGDIVADGQGRAQPFTFLFTSLLTDDNWTSAMIKCSFGISALGDTQLLAEGQPHIPQSGNQWAAPLIAGALSRLRTWDPPVCGPNVDSTVTGRQEDQLFHPGSEALADDGAGAEFVRLFAALKLHAERPANHCEADGSPLDPDLHPQLVFWDSRVHSSSADKLGKIVLLAKEQAHGRWGADTQHFLFSSLVASVRQTACPAAQWLLRQMTTAYLLQRTSTPGRPTTATWSAREWGYEGLFAVQVHRSLADRTRAAQVVQRCRDRIAMHLVPYMANREWIFTFTDVGSLGAGTWAIMWQEALGAYGLQLFGEQFNVQAALDIAYRIASRVLAVAWVFTPEGWRSRQAMPVDGQQPPLADGSFNAYGMCLAPEVIMRSSQATAAERERATLILQQIYAAGDMRWLPVQR